MKKLLSLFLCLLMIFSISVPVMAAPKEQPIKVKLCNYMDKNGKWVKEKYIKFDSEPIIENGRTLVPIRAIAEELGYFVSWDNEAQAAVITYKIAEYGGKGEEHYGKKNQTLRFANLLYRIEAKNSSLPANFKAARKEGFNYTETENVYSIGEILDTSGYRLAELRFWMGSKYAQVMVGSVALQSFPITHYVMDVPPKIVKGRTLIPLRAFGEMLGLDVSWNNDTRTVIISA